VVGYTYTHHQTSAGRHGVVRVEFIGFGLFFAIQLVVHLIQRRRAWLDLGFDSALGFSSGAALTSAWLVRQGRVITLRLGRVSALSASKNSVISAS
jgi:hypothetical protein